MAFSVTMPALGESVSEGTVSRWLKSEGDRVERDEPLLEVSTDKVDTEIPSPAAGILERIVVAEDETVPVGAELAVIADGTSGSGVPSGGAGEGSAAAAIGGAAEAGAPDPGQAADTPGTNRATAETPVTDRAPADTRGSSPAPGPASTESAGEGGASPQSPAQPAPGASSSGSDSPAGQAAASGIPVTMPALGESVSEGTVSRWLKQVGDTVKRDEPLLEVSTDKVDTEIPSPASGTLVSIDVQADETVPVGAQLALIGDSSAGRASAPATAPAPATVAGAPVPAQPAAQAQPAPQDRPAPPVQPAPQDQPAPPVEPVPPAQPAAQAQAAAPDQPETQDQAALPSAPPAATPQAGEEASGPTGDEGAPYVTPLVRRLAADRGVDISTVRGSGVGGRIRKQDILEAAQANEAERARRAAGTAREPVGAPTARTASDAAVAGPSDGARPAGPEGRPTAGGATPPLRGTTEKMSRLRRVIAQRMVESLQVSAQLTTVVEADLTDVARLRARAKREFEAREGVRLSFLPFLAKATVDALKAFPKVNASIEGDSIVYHPQENLGIAVDTERGLLVPVIHGAGDLNIAGLARKIADIAGRTRENKITPDELSGGTFTLTNTGSRGALFDTPIINQPQVGILGTGAVVKRAVVLDDPRLGETIAIRSMVYLALSYDHRLVDGADAARFLNAIKQRLEEAQFEGDLGL